MIAQNYWRVEEQSIMVDDRQGSVDEIQKNAQQAVGQLK